MDHQELVSEMASVERMSTVDRLKHAKKRRSQQMKKWNQYEKQLEKESSKKRKHGSTSSSSASKKPRNKRKENGVRFISSITLLEAATRNDIDEVRKLLQKHVSPDVTNEDGLTALHQCCIDDNEELLKLLLEYGANVNACDSELWTPLHAAATCGHVHLCKYLIERGANLLAVNADGNMPYDICEDEVTLDYIETEMAKRGITQEQIDETRLVMERRMLADFKQLAAAGADLETRDHMGATPLHVAAANGFIEVAEFLLEHHVSVDVRDNDSWQPIHAAAYWAQPDILDILVENGADIDARTRTGETPFDLCDDPDLKQKILDVKDEIEVHRQTNKHRGGSVRGRHRVSTRSLPSTTGMMYSSNSSLPEKKSSASLRRSSLRGEKGQLFKKEAHEEALHFGLRTMVDEDDLDDHDEKENVPATNIDDVTIIIPEENRDASKKSQASPPRGAEGGAPRSGSAKPPTASKPPAQAGASKSDPRVKAEQAPRKAQGNEVQRSSAPGVVPTASQQPPKPQAAKPSEPQGSKPKGGKQGEPQVTKQPSGKTVVEVQAPKPQSNQAPRPGAQQPKPAPAPKPLPASKPQPQPPPSHGAVPAGSSQPPPPASQHLPPTRESRSGSLGHARSSSPPRGDGDSEAPSSVSGRPGPRYPSGVPGGTLSDLKRQRAEMRRETLDQQVQSMFLESIHTDTHKSRSGSVRGSGDPPQPPPPQHPKDRTQNGHNNNTRKGGQGYHGKAVDQNIRRYTAPNHSPVIGGDEEKQKCCVVM